MAVVTFPTAARRVAPIEVMTVFRHPMALLAVMAPDPLFPTVILSKNGIDITRSHASRAYSLSCRLVLRGSVIAHSVRPPHQSSLALSSLRLCRRWRWCSHYRSPTIMVIIHNPPWCFSQSVCSTRLCVHVDREGKGATGMRQTVKLDEPFGSILYLMMIYFIHTIGGVHD